MTMQEQIRRYADHLETMVPDVSAHDIIGAELHAETSLATRLRWRPVAVAAVAFAAVLVAIGGVALLLLGGESEVIDAPPTPPITTVTTTDVTTTTTAQLDPYAGVLAGTWEIFSTESGLPAGPVYKIAGAPSGAVWAVAADDGIYRFDGSVWHLVTFLPDGVDAGIWLAVSGDEQVVTPGYRADDERAGLLVFDGVAWTDLSSEGLVPADLGVTVRRTLADGDVLVGGFSDEQGYPVLVRVGADGIDVMVGDTAPTSGASGPYVHGARVITADGVMWEGGIRDISTFDGASVSLLEVPVPGAEEVCCVAPLAEDPAGGMWIQVGLNLFHYDMGWQLVAAAAELPDVLISSSHEQVQEWAILPSPDGGVWLVHTNGIGYYDGSMWTGYSRSEAEGRGIPTGRYGRLANPVAGPDGSVWTIAKHSGVDHLRIYRYVDSAWSAVQVPAAYPMSHINGVLTITPDGSAWVATVEGVARFTSDS